MAYETIDALTDEAFAAYRAHLASNPGDRANVCEAPGTTHRMRAALVLAGAWGQCVNGGPHQYVDNG